MNQLYPIIRRVRRPLEVSAGNGTEQRTPNLCPAVAMSEPPVAEGTPGLETDASGGVQRIGRSTHQALQTGRKGAKRVKGCVKSED